MMHNKSAETRFKNDQTRAAQNAMGSNMSARQSFRPTGAKVRRGRASSLMGPPASSPVGAPGVPAMSNVASPPMPNSSAGAPGVSGLSDTEPANAFDAKTEALMNQVRLERLMGTQEMHDANMLVNMRDYWKGKSSIDKGAQVMDIMSVYAPPME